MGHYRVINRIQKNQVEFLIVQLVSVIVIICYEDHQMDWFFLKGMAARRIAKKKTEIVQ